MNSSINSVTGAVSTDIPNNDSVRSGFTEEDKKGWISLGAKTQDATGLNLNDVVGKELKLEDVLAGKLLDKKPEVTVSLAELLSLLSDILEASGKLRNQMMINRVDNAEASVKMASAIARDKESDAMLKFGLSMMSGVMSMGLTAASSIKIGSPKGVQDKHVQLERGNPNAGVKDLSPQELNDLSSRLQQARTQKYSGVNQMAGMADNVTQKAVEMNNASEVEQQQQAEAAKSHQDKLAELVNMMIDSLAKELTKVLQLTEEVTKSGSANLR